MLMKRFTLLLVIMLLSPLACSSGESDGTTASEEAEASQSGQQVNLCLLLDLSDRIEPTQHVATPAHYKRDQEVALTVADFFRQEMLTKGAFASKGKMRTIFSPPPADGEINRIAGQLRIDLEDMTPAEKKTVYDSLSVWYRDGLEDIYASVLENKNYVGADIWRFFKEGQVQDYCLLDTSDYRNILVIVTDGYLYHDASRDQQANRSAYITGPYLSSQGLRNNPEWKTDFDEKDYGIISTVSDLDGLEVLVLEVNPSDAHPNDFEILEAFWSKWFDEMGVDRYRLLKSDLPVNTSEVILGFLKN